MSQVVQSTGASRHNLQSISTINSNLNQISDQNTQLPNFRNDHGIRAPPYGAIVDQRAGTSIPGKRNNINLEAVQAYYNTNEPQVQISQPAPKSANIDGIQIKAVGSPTLVAQQRLKEQQNAVHEFLPNKKDETDGKSGVGGGTNIINNIMHINHSGANINIMSVPGSQNNFIFNQSAPINLNFYKNGQKKTKGGAGPTEDELIDVNERK